MASFVCFGCFDVDEDVDLDRIVTYDEINSPLYDHYGDIGNVVIDHGGNVWFTKATDRQDHWAGLIRYDGAIWETYFSYDTMSQTYWRSHPTRPIAVDSSNQILTSDGFLFDGYGWEEVVSIIDSNDQGVLVGDFDEDDNLLYTVNNYNSDLIFDNGFSEIIIDDRYDGYITSIKSRNNVFWIGKLRETGYMILRLVNNELEFVVDGNRDFDVDSSGDIWYSEINTVGLVRYQNGGETLFPAPSDYEYIDAIAIDSEDRIWFALGKSGEDWNPCDKLGMFDGEGFHDFGPCGDELYSITPADGSVWVSGQSYSGNYPGPVRRYVFYGW